EPDRGAPQAPQSAERTATDHGSGEPPAAEHDAAGPGPRGRTGQEPAQEGPATTELPVPAGAEQQQEQEQQEGTGPSPAAPTGLPRMPRGVSQSSGWGPAWR